MSASGGETQPSVEDAPTSHARSPTTEAKEANHASSAGASQPADEAATTQPSTDALTGDLHRTNNEAELCSEEPSVRDEDDSLDDKGGLSIIARLRALGVRGLEDTEEEVAVRAAVLSSFDLKGVAELLREGKAKRIVVMVGAGISVNAGIPDFRTPGTGLYDNLQRFNLPHPQAVFEIDFFRRNPQPFFLLAKELMPGQFRPTLAHHFIRLLADKGLLLRCYTQNIDSLETRAGLPEELLVAAHGNFDTAACIDCGKRHPSGTVHDAIRDSYLPRRKAGQDLRQWDKKTSSLPRIQPFTIGDQGGRCGRCDGLVKPGIVFFGENLPDRFFHLYHDDMVQADLLIVMGTSLVVHPFAGLIELVRLDVPRLLINRERAGEGSLPACACGLDRRFNFDASTNYRDALFRGDCDDGVRQLCALLGWKADLDALAASSRAAELPSGTQ